MLKLKHIIVFMLCFTHKLVLVTVSCIVFGATLQLLNLVFFWPNCSRKTLFISWQLHSVLNFTGSPQRQTLPASSWFGSKSTKKVPLSAVTSITDGLKRLYLEKLKPLETTYRFHDFVSPPLTSSDFDAKPMVMLLGQYSTGKTTFIKHLLQCDYPGAHIGPEPTTDRYVVVMIAISASNTGGAWDNAKKYIEAGAFEHARQLGPKGSDAHKAAVIGDTVGDPLKDTSGPSLNILIKLMAVELLVFAPFFATHGGLLFKYL